MSERDWLLFWSFLANRDFRRFFMLAKYIGWEDNPKQMIILTQHERPLRFYSMMSKKQLFHVLLVGQNETQMESFLKLLRSNGSHMNVDSYSLVAGGCPCDFVFKRVTKADLIAGSYSLVNHSSFSALWVLDADEYSLMMSLEQTGAHLPSNLPRMGISLDRRYGPPTDASPIKVLVSMEDRNTLDELKAKEIVRNQQNILKCPSLGLVPAFITANPEPSDYLGGLKTLGVIALAGLAVTGYLRFIRREATAIRIELN